MQTTTPTRPQMGLAPGTHNHVSKEQANKGRLAEDAFEGWLKREGFSYLPICQDRHSFAPLFQGNLKRPDFLVLIESIGMIAVDVKSYTLTRGQYTLPYETELRRAMTFERMFRMPIWYAYWNFDEGFAHWISGLKSIEVGVMRESRTDKQAFLAIDLKHFHAIKTSADFGQLYTDRAHDLAKLSGRKPPVRYGLDSILRLNAHIA